MSTPLEEYVRWVTEYGLASDNADSVKTNKAYDRIMASYRNLQESEATAELLSLLDHSDPWVRVWAASHTLHLNEDKARSALEKIPDKQGALSLNAAMVLEQWDDGTLEIP